MPLRRFSARKEAIRRRQEPVERNLSRMRAAEFANDNSPVSTTYSTSVLATAARRAIAK